MRGGHSQSVRGAPESGKRAESSAFFSSARGAADEERAKQVKTRKQASSAQQQRRRVQGSAEAVPHKVRWTTSCSDDGLGLAEHQSLLDAGATPQTEALNGNDSIDKECSTWGLEAAGKGSAQASDDANGAL